MVALGGEDGARDTVDVGEIGRSEPVYATNASVMVRIRQWRSPVTTSREEPSRMHRMEPK